jgi:hypothetical protein
MIDIDEIALPAVAVNAVDSEYPPIPDFALDPGAQLRAPTVIFVLSKYINGPLSELS